jgi:hypothetical protein
MVGVKNAKNIILEFGGGGVKPCEGAKGSKRKGDAKSKGREEEGQAAVGINLKLILFYISRSSSSSCSK